MLKLVKDLDWRYTANQGSNNPYLDLSIQEFLSCMSLNLPQIYQFSDNKYKSWEVGLVGSYSNHSNNQISQLPPLILFH